MPDVHFMGVFCSAPQNRSSKQNTSNATTIIFHIIFLPYCRPSAAFCVIMYLTLSSSQQTPFGVLWLNLPVMHFFINWIFFTAVISVSSCFMLTKANTEAGAGTERVSAVIKSWGKAVRTMLISGTDALPTNSHWLKVLANFIISSRIGRSSLFSCSNISNQAGRKITLQPKLKNFITRKVKCETPFPSWKLQTWVSLFISDLMRLQTKTESIRGG